MAVGKNKKLSKGKKGNKKKPVDSFLKKEWFDVQVPSVFPVRSACKTVVNKSQGTHIASESLKGRVFEFNQHDLKPESYSAYNKFKFIVEDVKGKNCITNFYGMSVTTDKIWSLVKKGQTTIEAFVEFKTKDNFVLRVFALCFIARTKNQVKRTCYAKAAQVKAIRRIMCQMIIDKFSTGNIKNLLEELVSDVFASDVMFECSKIKPVKDFTIKKVKVVKRPKVDFSRLHELHEETAAVDGVPGKVVNSIPAELREPPVKVDI